MNKDLLIFDWEIFPHWNCMVCGKYTPDVKNFEYTVITSDLPFEDYVRQLKDLAFANYLVGFNVKGYDMQMLNFAIQGYTPEDLYQHSQLIINDKSDDGKWKDISYWRKYDFVDLQDDLKTMGSLKQFESNTGLSIRETTVPFGKEDLTEAEKAEIIFYCKADVAATNQLCTARWGYLMSKAHCTRLSDLTEAECLKNTSQKVCAKMLKAKKQENMYMTNYTIPLELDRVFRENIHSSILAQFENTPLVNDFAYKVKYMKNEITYGTGGVHSTYIAGYDKSGSPVPIFSIADDNYILVNADFENLYPSLLCNFNYFATGVPEDGRKLFKFLLSSCRSLKKKLKQLYRDLNGNINDEYRELFQERDSTKLILNASTGAMRLKFSDLFDPPNIISLCLTGQLLCTCMAKIVHNIGATILQMNTDGVLFRIHKDKLTDATELLTKFSKEVNIPLEIDTEYAVFQKDVNNYILLSEPQGKPKLKGRWAKQSGSNVPLVPLNAPIINEAVIAYYCNNVPLETTVRNCKHPLKFMMTTMKGRTYDGVMYTYDGIEHDAMNVNRVYASTDLRCGTLHKYKLDDSNAIYKRDKIASIPDHCGCWNEEVPVDGQIPNLDYNWYVNEANKKLKDMCRVG